MIINKRKENPSGISRGVAYAASENMGSGGQVAVWSSSKGTINLYQNHPNNIITLHEFHQIALNRL